MSAKIRRPSNTSTRIRALARCFAFATQKQASHYTQPEEVFRHAPSVAIEMTYIFRIFLAIIRVFPSMWPKPIIFNMKICLQPIFRPSNNGFWLGSQRDITAL